MTYKRYENNQLFWWGLGGRFAIKEILKTINSFACPLEAHSETQKHIHYNVVDIDALLKAIQENPYIKAAELF